MFEASMAAGTSHAFSISVRAGGVITVKLQVRKLVSALVVPVCAVSRFDGRVERSVNRTLALPMLWPADDSGAG